MVSLVVIEAPEFGIIENATEIQHRYNNSHDEDDAAVETSENDLEKIALDKTIPPKLDVLNPMDDFDRAIISKLHANKPDQMEEVQAKDPEFKPEPREEWVSPSKRADINSLRQLVKKAKEPEKIEETPAEQGENFLKGKLSRMFSRK